MLCYVMLTLINLFIQESIDFFYLRSTNIISKAVRSDVVSDADVGALVMASVLRRNVVYCPTVIVHAAESCRRRILQNRKKYVLWNVYLSNACCLHLHY